MQKLGVVFLIACSPLSVEPAQDRSLSQGAAVSSTVGVCTTIDHFVSASCNIAHQCGTSALPFCTVQQGVDLSPDGAVQVSAGDYDERVEVTRSIQINAETGARIRSTGTALSITGAIEVSIRGLSLIADFDPATANVLRQLVSQTGDASVVMEDVAIEQEPARYARYSQEITFAITEGSGGALTLTRVNAVVPGPQQNIAVRVHEKATVAVSFQQSTLSMQETSKESVGVLFLGNGALTLEASTITVAGSPWSRVIEVAQAAAPRRAIALSGATLHAGRSRVASVLTVVGADILRVSASVLRAQGSATTDDARRGVGLVADSVSLVEIDKTEITGLESAVSNRTAYQPSSTIGVVLRNTAKLPGVRAHISDSTIHAGSTGDEAFGILSESVPLTLETSRVYGSLVALRNGNLKGPKRGSGVELRGEFPEPSFIRNNIEIVGGDTQSPCFIGTGGAAVFVSGNSDTEITANQSLRGVFSHSGCSTQGVRLLGGTHLVANNVLITAGQADEDGVAAIEVKNATATISNNATIIGNADEAKRASGTGIAAVDSLVTVTNNARIAGGFGSYSSGLTASGGLLNASGNFIEGGVGTYQSDLVYGVSVVGGEVHMSDNVISDCTMGGHPDCAKTRGYGLFVRSTTNSTFSNNRVIARGTACRFGGDPAYSMHLPMSLSFEHNACTASASPEPYPQPAIGLALYSYADAANPIIASNVLDGAEMGFYDDAGYRNGPSTKRFELRKNNVVARSDQRCLVGLYAPPTLCFQDVSTVNASSTAFTPIVANVSVAPDCATLASLNIGPSICP